MQLTRNRNWYFLFFDARPCSPPLRAPTTAWRTRTISSRYTGKRPPLMCCGRRPDGPAAQSSALDQEERRGRGQGDWEELQSHHVFCPRLWGAVSNLLGHRCGVGGWRLVEYDRTGLGMLALFHQGRDSLVSLLEVASVVVVLVVRRGLFEFSFAFEGLFVLEGSTSSFQPLFPQCSHVVGGAFVVLFALPRSQRRTTFGRHRRSVQPRCRCSGPTLLGRPSRCEP